ncbi:baseplate hub protein [Brevundimonas sp.]|uniref:baseplate hub domain-containing protein n=1 Tax=Brevundimonas sp. TaxID=1871086 RepID=UPI003D12A036
MRDIPEEMAARIESGAATLCHAWIVERVDEARLGFTDHDRDLSIDGVVCRAASGWSQGAAETAEGLAAGSLAVGGVLDDERIVETDIAAGLWDRARVALWRVDWARPDLKVLLGRGTLSRIRREGEGFTAEINGPLAALERVVGRTFGRTCDAALGDARCSVDPDGRTCDKRWETCVQTFGNGVNFQGFPDIPGDDFLTAYPAAGGRHDGGSRR